MLSPIHRTHASKAFWQGLRAARRDRYVRRNPYVAGSTAYRDWSDGFDVGMLEHRCVERGLTVPQDDGITGGGNNGKEAGHAKGG